jgi:predicted enzyme related to lactoylglutathione lyase
MGERTSYPHGTFSWVENSTTQQDAAKSFYSTLFGWDYEDSPVGDGIVYSMAKLDGQYVAAISPQMQDERAMGVPPHWNNYITVDDVDGVSARVEELGGTLHAPPFDVMDVGRMSALSDASGAVVYFWEPRRHIGAGLVNVPGTLTWNELNTRAPEDAQRFWNELLGWRFEQVSSEPAYWVIFNGERSNGGMRVIGHELPAQAPAHWIPYFAVDSIDAIGAQATAAGGQVLVPKTDVAPNQSFGVLADPVGAVFALAEAAFDD